MLRKFLCGGVLFAAGVCAAADRYVATNGNDNGNSCTNIGSPCRTLVRCFNVMSPGETCYLRAGTYTAPTSTSGGNGAGYDLGGPTSSTYGGCDGVESRCICDSGQARCKGGTSASAMKIISAYQAESVKLVPQSPESYVVTLRNSGGSNLGNGNWVRLTGMTIYGRVGIWGNHVGFEATKNVFMCPGGQADGNIANLFATKSGEHNTNSMHVWDNLFLHTTECNPLYNQIDMSCSDNHDRQCTTADGQPGSSPDCSGSCSYNAPPSWVHFYDVNGAIFENNDFLVAAPVDKHGDDSFGQGFGLKEGNQNCIFRNNYLAATGGGKISQQIWMYNNRYNGSAAGNRNYQNIVVNGGSAMAVGGNNWNSWTQGWDQFYNNTVVGSGACVTSNVDGIVEQTHVFNNICYNTSTYINWQSSGGRNVAGQAYWDHNNYFGGSSFRDGHAGQTSHSSLTSWLTSSGAGPNAEQNSRSIVPGFVSASDLRLTAASVLRAGGRGGSFPSVLGAYVTGTETIGCSFDPRCHGYGGSPGGGTVPPDVTGVRRTDTHP